MEPVSVLRALVLNWWFDPGICQGSEPRGWVLNQGLGCSSSFPLSPHRAVWGGQGLSSQSPSRAAQAFLWPLQTPVFTCAPHNDHMSVQLGAWPELLGSESLGGEEEEEREREEVVRGCGGVGGVLGPPFKSSPPCAPAQPCCPPWPCLARLGPCAAPGGLQGRIEGSCGPGGDKSPPPETQPWLAAAAPPGSETPGPPAPGIWSELRREAAAVG